MRILQSLLICLFGICNVIYAAEEWRNLSSLMANFKQQIQGERGAIPVVYSGTLYAANNKVKWEYTAPLAKEVYLEKNEAYIYEPQLKQVTIGSLKENIDFLQILKKVKKVSENHYQTTIAGTNYFLVIKDSKPYSLSYKDDLDNNVIIVFDNVQINASINNEIFIFQPPDDVDYIDAN